MSFTPTYTGSPEDNLSSDPWSIGYTWTQSDSATAPVSGVTLPALKVGTYLVTCNIFTPSSAQCNMFVAYDSSYCSGGYNATYSDTIQVAYVGCYGSIPADYGVASDYYILCSQASGGNAQCGNGNVISASGLLIVNVDLTSESQLQFWWYSTNSDTYYYSVQVCRQG